jgi:pimeloyl-ACP methyl ester carboxylesterase
MNVYFLSGIAADSRLFKHIILPEGFEAVYLDWIPPIKNENIESYSKRLASSIDTNEKFILIGLSLGGIIASEIAKDYPPVITIILGSVPTADQLPFYYKFLGKLNINRIIPGEFYKWAANLKHRFSKTKTEDKEVILKMIKDADPNFIYWGLNAVLKWKNGKTPSSLIHVHGTKDEVFPLSFTRPTHIIKNGSHLLAISHPNEVNLIIREALVISKVNS